MVPFLLVSFIPLYLLQSLHSSQNGVVVRSAFVQNNRVRNNRRNICGAESALKSMARAGGADILKTVREGVVEVIGSDDEWMESIAVLSRYMGMKESDDDDENNTLEEAELLLADGLNWKGWAMTSKIARKYMKPQWPDASKLIQSLEWLRNGPLQLNKDELSDVIRKHPKLYIPCPEETFQKALSVAPKKYQDIDALVALIHRDPSALRLTYNCAQGNEGCGSECGNCWVTYKV